MKILAYNSSARGSGQFVRCLKIANIITKNFQKSRFLILVGNSYVNKQLSDRTDVLRMPEISKSIKGEHISRLGNIAETFAIRKAIIESTIEYYNPDIFLVDSRPTGLNGELLDVLKKLKLQSKCKIVLMFRDIVDDPDLVKKNWAEQNVYKLINEIYDKVIIFGNKETYNAIEKYELSQVEKKIFHVGYLGSENNSPSKKEISGHILITVGGGFDGDTIVKLVCEYINNLTTKNSHKFSYKIVLGSNSPLKTNTLFECYSNISNNTQIITHVENLESLISEAELVISMCGYNTVTELIGSYKKVILIPRTHSGSEQLIRSNIISQLYDGIWILPEKDLTIEKLGSLINQVMIFPRPEVREKTNANENLIDFFKQELGYEQ